MEEHTGIVDDVPMRWVEHGEGRPVVLVHGIPTSLRLWRRVMPLVEGRTLAVEMLGYGASMVDTGDHDIGLSSQAARLLGWLDVTDLTAPCWSGMTWAEASPRSPPPGARPVLRTRPDQRGLLRLLADRSVKMIRAASGRLQHLPGLAIYPAFVQLLLRGHDDFAMARQAIKMRPYAEHGAAQNLMRQVSALDVRDTIAVGDLLPTLQLPARVVWGDADRFQRVSYERLAADLGTGLTRISGGKHFTPEDHPLDIARAINVLVTG